MLVGLSMGGMIAHRFLQKCEQIKPYIKRLFLVGTPSMGVIGFTKYYIKMSIAFKYFQNLKLHLKPFGTPICIHKELKEIYDRYAPYYEIKDKNKYYSDSEDEFVLRGTTFLKNA